MSSITKLSMLPPGGKGRIVALENGKSAAERLTDLGFYPGVTVKVLFRSVFGDPTAYMTENTVIALRRSEAEKINVIPL